MSEVNSVVRVRTMRLFVASFLFAVSTAVTGTEFMPGQVWAYHTRAGEPGSTVTVLKVETYKDLGNVVHIRVDGVNIRLPIQGHAITEIPHLPFKEAAVRKSVTKLVRRVTSLPEFQGYDTWREAYLAGKAGAFDITVSATLDTLSRAKWEERK
jgi:hypothetical protein